MHKAKSRTRTYWDSPTAMIGAKENAHVGEHDQIADENSFHIGIRLSPNFIFYGAL